MAKLAGTERIITVSTLGRFSLTFENVTVSESVNRSNRIWNLLAYMFLHKDKDMSQTELIEALWPDEDNSNPGNTLKTLVYRVRSMLAESFGSDFQLIISRRGSYALNNEYTYNVDIEKFEKFVDTASQDGPLEKRLDNYSRAFELYEGDFLPRLSNEMWVIPLSMHYHTLYLDAVKSYAKLLIEIDRFRDAVDTCGDATKIDPYDEDIHALLITAYARQGNEPAALAHYEAATDTLYRNLGVRPSDKLRNIYLEIMRSSRSVETDLSIIAEQLRSPPDEEGAFVCDFGFFKEAYRLEARRAARSGTCVHIALMTVSMQRGALPPLGLLSDTMEQLLDIIIASLRRGDIVSRYSGAQYIMLLPNANFEDSEQVLGRIIEIFHAKYPKNKLIISTKLQQLDCIV